MKWIELEEFLKLKIEPDRDFETLESLVIEVFKYFPAKIMVRLDEHEGKKYYQYGEVRLLHPDIHMSVKYDQYRKKYHITADMREHFQNITTDTVNSVKSDLNKPNEIGVLSAKKILEWVHYYEAIYSRIFRKDQENGSAKAAFLKSIEGLPVKWSHDKKQGSIVKNGVEFSFTIGDTYVSKKLELHYSVDASLESFKALADNKYKDKT